MIDLLTDSDQGAREMYRCIDIDINTTGLEGSDVVVILGEYYPLSLWDVHEFVRKVISSKKLAFEIHRYKVGKPRIDALPLAIFAKYLRPYIARLPHGVKPYGYVGLFYDCCRELDLIFDPIPNLWALHRDGKYGAEVFNDLLLLIKEKSNSPKYKKLARDLARKVNNNFKSMKRYVDDLFKVHNRLLVLRIDFGYLKSVSPQKKCEEALADFAHFLNNRRGNALFQSLVGYIRSLEYGVEGKGWHFHCILFFNGSEVQNDVGIAHLVGEYWKTKITDNDGVFFNCNKSKNEYKHCGIGMVHYSDELKRYNLLNALAYLTKKESLIGFDTPPKCKMITKGELMNARSLKPGPKRRDASG